MTLTSDAQVARERELEAAAERGPVDRRERGHGQALERAQRAAEVDEEAVDLRLGHRRALDEVRARAERARGGGAHDQHARAAFMDVTVRVRGASGLGRSIRKDGEEGAWLRPGDAAR